MKKILLTVLLLCVIEATAHADLVTQPYIAGDFDGWDPGAIPMTETSPGSGIWTYTISGLVPGQYQQFKITPGDWSTTIPASNSWYNVDASGEVTITFNTNVVSDGWLPEQFRVGVSTEPGTWTLAGNFGSDPDFLTVGTEGDLFWWNNIAPEMAMTPLGGGIYSMTKTFAAGFYEFKPTQTFSWDAIGTDGRSINAWNYGLDLGAEAEVTIYVDAYAGMMQVSYFYPDPPADPNKPVDQYMWLAQDDSEVPGGDGPSNIRYFEVTATYTTDEESPIVDANLVNLNWGWDPVRGERGVEKVSQTWTPGPGYHTSGTVKAVYKTHYVEGDPNNSTDLPGYWEIRLEVTDGTGTAHGIAGIHRIFETCGEAAAADPEDPFDGYYDTNNDCIVSLPDFADFAASWLYQGVKYE